MDQLNLEVAQLTSTPNTSFNILDSPQECNLYYILHCQNHDAIPSIAEYATEICEPVDNATKLCLQR